MLVENAVLTVGATLGVVAVVRWMIRANRAEKRVIDRRYQEWLDNGAVPEEKPNFFSGNQTN
jgi:hypothetical protein